MVTTATIAAIDRRAGVSYVTLDNGTQFEIPGTLADLKQFVRNRIRDIDPEFIALLGIARWLAMNPTGTNPGQLVGKTISLDLSALTTANIFTVL